jgi:hypothetical protein
LLVPVGAWPFAQLLKGQTLLVNRVFLIALNALE